MQCRRIVACMDDRRDLYRMHTADRRRGASEARTVADRRFVAGRPS